MKYIKILFLLMLGNLVVQAQDFDYISGLINEHYVYETIDYSKESIFYPTGDENTTHALSSRAIEKLVAQWKLAGYSHTLTSSENRKTRIELSKDGLIKIVVFSRFTRDEARKLSIVLDVRYQ